MPLHPCWSPDSAYIPGSPWYSLLPFEPLGPPMPLHPLLTNNAPWHPTLPASPNTPYLQNRNLVVKSGTTACEHDMSWACGSGCCFVRCTSTPSMPPGRGIMWPRVAYNRPSCLLLLSVCNWLFSWVHPVHNIPYLVVRSTSSVLWSSANFCNISQNIHSKAPVALQHWKTN